MVELICVADELKTFAWNKKDVLKQQERNNRRSHVIRDYPSRAAAAAPIGNNKAEEQAQRPQPTSRSGLLEARPPWLCSIQHPFSQLQVDHAAWYGIARQSRSTRLTAYDTSGRCDGGDARL
jgi:hypothetical protein